LKAEQIHSDDIFSYKSLNYKNILSNHVEAIFYNRESDFTEVDGKGTLRGIVVDSSNGEALAFGNVLIKELNRGASTDSKGYFNITSIPANNTYTIIISYVGYKTKEISVFILPDKVTDLKIELSPGAIEFRPVEKVGDRIIDKNATDLGLQRISIKDIQLIPKGVETDVFRSIQYLPGVQSTGDVTARYYVRGSSSNENLVLLNGVTLYNPFHALGIFSVIDPELINSVEFYKGGFGSEYGSRLSSIMNIVTKDGNKKNISANVTVSSLTGKASLEGPIPNGSFILTGRKSYNSDALKYFLNDENVPSDFYDLGFKLNYSNSNFINGAKFVLHGFKSNDVLENNSSLKEDVNWTNSMFGFRWFQVTDIPLFYEIGLSWSGFEGNVIPNYSQSKPKSNTVNDISVNFNINYIFESQNEIEFGLDISNIETKLYLQNSIGTPSVINSNGTNISVFGKYKFLEYENFGFDAGARLNLSSLTQSRDNSFLLEPRISTTYRIFPWLALKAAWGIYSQELTTLSDENEVISLFEPWIIIPSYLPVSKAIHYTGGLKADIFEYASLDIQGYYKVLKNIPTINDNKILATDPDLLSASGESYGWEFMLNYNKEPFSFTASYSLGWSYKHLDDWTYYPRFDTRNTVSLLGVVNLGAQWQFSFMWMYNSGKPFTQSLGYYDKLYFSNLHYDKYLLEEFVPLSILSDKNLGRLPVYHRLDLNLSKKFILFWFKVEIEASIINVYDRKNIFYFDRSTGEKVYMLPFLPSATIRIEI
jgi:hypothetical protein